MRHEIKVCRINESAGLFQLDEFSKSVGKNFGLLSVTEVLFSGISSVGGEGFASTGAAKDRLSSTKHIRNDSVE